MKCCNTCKYGVISEFLEKRGDSCCIICARMDGDTYACFNSILCRACRRRWNGFPRYDVHVLPVRSGG